MQFRIAAGVYPHVWIHTCSGTRRASCTQNGAVADLKFCRGSGSSSLKNSWSCFSFASHYTKTIFGGGTPDSAAYAFLSTNTSTVSHTGQRGRCLRCSMQLLSMRTGWPLAPGQHSLRMTEACAPVGSRVTSSGRGTDSGWRGRSRGGASVHRGCGGEFNRAGWVPGLELPKQFFIGSAQSLLLLGLFLHVLLEVRVLFRQLSARRRMRVRQWPTNDTQRLIGRGEARTIPHDSLASLLG